MSEHLSARHTAHQGAGDDVNELVERAFHYRGDVTISTDGGESLTGYVFNRNVRVSEPFVQLIETRTGDEITIPYQTITQVLFTGRDAAAASSKHFDTRQEERRGPGTTGPPSPSTRTE